MGWVGVLPGSFPFFSLKKRGKKWKLISMKNVMFLKDIVKIFQKSSILDLNHANISILKVILIDNNYYL